MPESRNPVTLVSIEKHSGSPVSPEVKVKGGLTLRETCRGFSYIGFTDSQGIECSLQESSSATQACIWLGCNEANVRACIPGQGWVPVTMPEGVDVLADTRMHLSQKQVKELLPYLQKFAKTGELK